jgi:hypothetical protein
MPTVISEAAIFRAVSFGFVPVVWISRAISEAFPGLVKGPVRAVADL